MTVGQLISTLQHLDVPSGTIVMIPDDLVRPGWSYLEFVTVIDGRLYLEGSGVED